MLSLLPLHVLRPLPGKFFPTIMRLILTYLLRLSSGMVLVGSLPGGPLSLGGLGPLRVPQFSSIPPVLLSALSRLRCSGPNLAILSMFSPLNGEPRRAGWGLVGCMPIVLAPSYAHGQCVGLSRWTGGSRWGNSWATVGALRVGSRVLSWDPVQSLHHPQTGAWLVPTHHAAQQLPPRTQLRRPPSRSGSPHRLPGPDLRIPPVWRKTGLREPNCGHLGNQEPLDRATKMVGEFMGPMTVPSGCVVPPQEGTSLRERGKGGDLRSHPGVLSRVGGAGHQDGRGLGQRTVAARLASTCPRTFLMRRSRTSFPMICSGVN